MGSGGIQAAFLLIDPQIPAAGVAPALQQKTSRPPNVSTVAFTRPSTSASLRTSHTYGAGTRRRAGVGGVGGRDGGRPPQRSSAWLAGHTCLRDSLALPQLRRQLLGALCLDVCGRGGEGSWGWGEGGDGPALQRTALHEPHPLPSRKQAVPEAAQGLPATTTRAPSLTNSRAAASPMPADRAAGGRRRRRGRWHRRQVNLGRLQRRIHLQLLILCLSSEGARASETQQQDRQ